MRRKILTVILCAALCSSAMAANAGLWWNKGWRYRTTVTRPTPWRDDAPRPVEAAVDFGRLLTEAGIEGEFDPASLRVIEPRADGAGVEVPFAYRSEYDPEAAQNRAWLAWMAHPEQGGGGVYHIYFDTRDRGIARAEYDAASLPPENLIGNPGFEDEENGLPSGWTAAPAELARLGRFAHTTGERSLKIVVDEKTLEGVEREVVVSRKVDVRACAGQEMVFECDLYAERAAYGAPVNEIQQFRADGSRILECAVEPRWLTIELAQGHLVQFRERGRFSPDAVAANVRVRFRCIVKDADTDEPVTGPDSFFTVWLDRLVMRPGERWPWPAETHGGYVTGALEEAPLNRAFEFTGLRRLAFNGASEGDLQSGTFNPNPRSMHWGLQAGTIEFWCRPSWKADDRRERIFFEASAMGFSTQSCVSRVREGDEDRLNFVIADADGTMREASGPAPFQAGQWHHVAATWDFPKAHLQLFFDGKRIGELGPEPTPWASSLFTTGGSKKSLGVGNSLDDTRSLPRQAFIGGNSDGRSNQAAEAAMDEFRVSDMPRYSDNFTPSRREFEPDEATRVLFHFENERDGVHGSDDRFVRGHLVCELPPQEETAPLDVRADNGDITHRAIVVKPYPRPEEFKANEAKSRFADAQREGELPDPRFVEYAKRQAERVVRGEDDAFVLDVGGDFEPLMQSITFERAADAGSETVLIPQWRANDNVVPFSVRSLAATLAPGAKDDPQRVFETFKYATATSYYYIASYCETLPTRHRPRTWWTFLKALNIYPSNECGPLNYTLSKLIQAAGISSNITLGTQHQFQQAFYLGRWRLFDLSARTYWLNRDDATVVGLSGIERDPYLLIRHQGPLGTYMRGEPYEPLFGTAERPHNMDFHLRAGEKAAICWHNEGRWFELRGEREPLPLAMTPPRFGNGAIVYSPVAEGEAAALDNMIVEVADDGALLRARDPKKPASLIYRLRCPYTLSDASATGAYEAQKADAATLSLSFDTGKTWTRVWANGDKTGAVAANMLDYVTARYEYWLKLDLAAGGGARVTGLRVRTTFVASPFALPGKLSLGRNRITFVGGPPAVPVKTVCRWMERRSTGLGVSFNTFSYPMLNDEPRRNLLIVSPNHVASLAVSLGGRAFDGKVVIEGLPESWLEGPGAQPIATKEDGKWVAAEFRLRPAGVAQGEIREFDVVLREGERERRETAQVLVAESPLAREAEAADEVSGAVSPADLPGASGGRVMRFSGKGTLRFAFSASNSGEYALWFRAQWKNRWGAGLTLALDDAEPRSVRAAGLRGSNDWTDAAVAYSKQLTSFGGRGASWYRISDVKLTKGEHVLALGAAPGADFDVVILLPQTAAVDRAASNLFHNWNYAPWQNPF